MTALNVAVVALNFSGSTMILNGNKHNHKARAVEVDKDKEVDVSIGGGVLPLAQRKFNGKKQLATFLWVWPLRRRSRCFEETFLRERRVGVHFPHCHRIDVVWVEDDARVGAHRFDVGVERREQTSGTVQGRYHERTDTREL